MKYLLPAILFLINASTATAQDTSADTLSLSEITVKAFEINRRQLLTPAAVNVVKPADIQRFDNTTLLAAIAMQPGVRFEERSPGSYRLNIRGSSVRSPFGVRNVKIYWNDIPFSDANGITYFNTFDMASVGSMEILKGPSGSMYGAGIGGVLLLNSRQFSPSTQAWGNVILRAHAGAYGQVNTNATHTFVAPNVQSVTTVGRQAGDGYRDNSALERWVLSHRSSFFYAKKAVLNASLQLTDLYYQTPGGLTEKQLQENPRQSRPATATLPSAKMQQAAIYQKLLHLGVSHEATLARGLTHGVSVFQATSRLRNPFITNYEIRDEQSVGGRTRFSYAHTHQNWQWRHQLGAEAQWTYSTFDNYQNQKGKLGKRLAEEEIQAFQGFVFWQSELAVRRWHFTAGGSLNRQNYAYDRRSDAPNQLIINDSPSVPFTPRVSVLRQLSPRQSVFVSWAKGFSPPTVQEFVTGYRPATQQFVPLRAEQGSNAELGWRGYFSPWFKTEVNVFRQQVTNALVRRLDANEREYFVNIGKSMQQGIEWAAQGEKRWQSTWYLSYAAAYTYHHFQSVNPDTQDRKWLASVPRHSYSLTLDAARKQTRLAVWLYGAGAIPLNDANTVWAKPYQLLQARLTQDFGKNSPLRVYVGGDNLLNQSYSLGNDINAFGNRFYNPAAPRNFYAGLQLQL